MANRPAPRQKKWYELYELRVHSTRHLHQNTSSPIHYSCGCRTSGGRLRWSAPILLVVGINLTGAGLHKRARRILDVGRIYTMVTETLTCANCPGAKRSSNSWIWLTGYACDVRVIRLLQERDQGNSPTWILKQPKENHTEEWLQHVSRYTAECMGFLQGPGMLPVTFPDPPQLDVVLSCKRLLSVYSQDILARLEDIKALHYIDLWLHS
ncbi:hypothetical protein CRENBAI_007686 [Crenichthys baileyi]|uniref:DUF6729 domain-containing protein n=1 Tax=Crenichthys baileyi TaxID=28760 RepID=A0AAV9SC61_9TELE